MDREVLKGIRVLEFAQFWVGPYNAEILSFLGAEVIKVESMRRMDPSRSLSITTGQRFTGTDQSTVFNDLNLNKLDVTLDLTQPKAVELVKRMAKVSDVVTQNNRPGVMDRLGLGYEALKEVRPDIIYLSSSARGATGPERHYAGFAAGFCVLSGLGQITG